MKTLRIGISTTLHSLPLVRGLQAGGEGYRTVVGRPGDLADQLRHGKLDAALIPSVEFFRGVGDAVVPGLCLASLGADRGTFRRAFGRARIIGLGSTKHGASGRTFAGAHPGDGNGL